MTTETQKAQEWEDLIEGDPATVEIDSYMQAGEILNKPSEESPLALRVSDMAFKGYVELWDTQTGRKILQPKNRLWQTRERKQKDGSQMFVTKDPHIEPNYGAKLLCPLNPESPDYSRLQGMGFKACRKHNIPNEAARMAHLKSSHKSAFTALELDRTDRMREEDRQLQKDVLAAMTGAAIENVNKSEPVVAASSTQEFSATCPDCGIEKTGNSKRRANAKIKMHRPHCKALKT